TKTGTQTLTVTYGGKTATYDVIVIPRELVSISVTTLPSKLSYLESKEILDLTGGILTLYYDNDTLDSIALTDEMVSGFDNTNTGKQTLTVTYEEKTASFDVTVTPKSVESVIIKNAPLKLTYLEGKDALEVTGGVITVNYNNGTYEDISMTSQMVTGFNNQKTGQQTLTVNYSGKTATFDVTVIPKSLVSINVSKKPSKLTYLEGKDELDVSGGKVKLYYNNDTENEIDMTPDMVTGFDNTKVGEQTLTVTYEEQTATFNITVVPKSLTGISIENMPEKLIYFEGKDNLDITGGIIKLSYDNGTYETLPLTLEMVSGFDNTNTGKQTLTVTYEVKTTSYSIEVLPYGNCGENLYWYIENGTLNISGEGAMTDYESAESAPWYKYADGIKDLYIDSGVSAVSSKAFAGLSLLKNVTLNDDNQTFTVYEEVLYKKDKTVILLYPGAKTETSFTVDTKVTEIADSAFANANNITDVYYDGIMSEWKALTVGNNNEPIINAKLHKYDLISIEALPNKLVYLEVKDELDLTGGLLKVSIRGEEPQFIPLTSNMISDFDNTRIGKQTLTVSFLGDEASFDITVIEKSISGIEVKKNPNKLSYLEGKDTLDVTGGIITVLYNNDTQEDVEMSLEMTSGFNNKVTGFQTITVTYMEKTTSFSLLITEKSVERIEIKTLPAKLTYLEAKDELNVSGGVIKVYYNNDTEAETAMTAEMISGFDNTVVGKQALTVSFGEKTDIFEITVIAKTLKSISVGKLPNKTSYLLNEEQFSAKGGLLTLNYDNDQSEDIELTSDMVSGYSNSKLGTVTLIVSYKGKMSFFSVTIVDELTWEYKIDDGVLTITEPPAEGTVCAAFYNESGRIIAFKELTVNEAQAIAAGTDKIKLFAVNGSFAPLCAAGDIKVNAN
ncbi:MAG: bacterial Ig-like domain-containing protein, partial [Clostridia bacterium]|nr:bacterial Ig-like domain-containing protein [Clostridia bacterium]